MTSPVFEPKAPRRKRRSALKRQRMLILVLLLVVGLLGGTFGVVYYYTSRNLVTLNGSALTDADGTRYYAKQINGEWVVVNEHGEVCKKTEDANNYGVVYETADGALIEIELATGKTTVVAIVDKVGEEYLQYNSASDAFDILMYPILEREIIKSIHVVNENGEFTFLQQQQCTNSKCQKKGDEYERYTGVYDEFPKNADGKPTCPKCGALSDRIATFLLEGFPSVAYDETMFSTLVMCTGYTSTYMRLDLEKVQQHGYAEYGLHEVKNYFEITDTSNRTHKVILGDAVVAGTGYYAMYEGNPNVYILKEMEQTEYNYTLSQALLSSVENFVAPTVMDTMATTDYFDVTDFEISTVEKLTDEMLDDPDFDLTSLISKVVNFSYVPIEQRRGGFGATTPYIGGVNYPGFTVNDYMIDDCLQSMMDLVPIRTVKLLTEQENEEGLSYFIEFLHEKDEQGKSHGSIGYCIQYTHNLERDAAQDYKPTKFVDQVLWISTLSEKTGTYFIYNEAYQMIVEVERASLEFLAWDAFTWVDADVFDGNIAYMQKLELLIPGGLTSGPYQGAKKLAFLLDNAESLANWDGKTDTNIPTGKIKIWVSVDGAQSKALTTEQIKQFRVFYQTLLYSSLSGSASCSPEQQQAFRDAAMNVAGGYATAAGELPQLVINMTYNTSPLGDGEQIERSYAFYKYGGGRQSFMAFNGNGGFYMLQRRVEKIVSDVGLIFTDAVINPQGKN